MVSGWACFWAKQLMPMLLKKSLTFVQLGVVASISVHLNNPPPTAAANTVLLVPSFLSNIIARVLPPILSGPLSLHSTFGIAIRKGLFSFNFK